MSYVLSAQAYDAIYEDRKDYQGEVRRVNELVARHKQTIGRALLDVGCGTGLHDQHFIKLYEVEGLDLSAEMLARARVRLPRLAFHQASMTQFRLERDFDVVVSLFSAVGHVLSIEALHSAISAMASHVLPGGVLIIEPWFLDGCWIPRERETNFLPDKGVLRITESRLQGQMAILEMHYFVGWPESTRYFFTEHRLRMHSRDDFTEGFRIAGLAVSFDEFGLTGRGLFVGSKPLG
ncbi:MAG TPA: class I SAM-dependent methyltransferase [Solirubrobacteraceae bacterium]|jgi:SAM-dependent methyltransferase|nr:class I SAM-dependent methyltransferase [Solirubrobacteraceae bacterium]